MASTSVYWYSADVATSEGNIHYLGAMELWDVQQWAIFVSDRNNGKDNCVSVWLSLGASSLVLMAIRSITLHPVVNGLLCTAGFHSRKDYMLVMAANWFNLPSHSLAFNGNGLVSVFTGWIFIWKDADNLQRTMKKIYKGHRSFFSTEIRNTTFIHHISFQKFMLLLSYEVDCYCSRGTGICAVHMQNLRCIRIL